MQALSDCCHPCTTPHRGPRCQGDKGLMLLFLLVCFFGRQGNFMEVHFPTPTVGDAVAKRGTRGTAAASPAQPPPAYCSFMDLLEDLMNRATFYPQDPCAWNPV